MLFCIIAYRFNKALLFTNTHNLVFRQNGSCVAVRFCVRLVNCYVIDIRYDVHSSVRSVDDSPWSTRDLSW